MKITKTDLRKIIEEELGSSLKEGLGGALKQTASDIKRRMKGGDVAKEVGALTARERGVQQLLQQMLTTMSQSGEQADQAVMTLLQRALDKMGGAPSEVLPGAEAGGPPEATTRVGGEQAAAAGERGRAAMKYRGVNESLDEDALVAEIIKRLGGE
jgi:hypothetical protein